MSVPVFYLLAILIVAAAVATVAAPTTRLVLAGCVVTEVLIGIMLIAAGAQVLGIIAVLLPAASLFAVAALLRRFGYGSLLGDMPSLTRTWPAAAGLGAGVAILLAWSANSGADDSAIGGSRPSLVTQLHYRSPIALGVVVALAIVSVAGALLIGGTGADERKLDHAAAQRRLREDRASARRHQRAAARAGRSGDRDTP